MPDTNAPDPTRHLFAWWNLQNLLDVHDSPQRPAWLQSRLKRELKGWTAPLLAAKIQNLASVIGRMNGGLGPDLLGVCEVENAAVLQQLVDAVAVQVPGRDYQLVHHDMSDKRGIDVAFVYDAKRYRAGPWFSHLVQKRSPTRDILQVSFEMLSNNKTFVLLGNHWPSRLGGRHDSAPFRMMAGETLAYFHDRVLHYLGGDTPVIAMGDFNDGPGARSLQEFALSSASRTRVVHARNPMFYNLMRPHVAAGRGTYVYGSGVECLDQVLVNRNVLKAGGWLRLVGGVEAEVEIVAYEGMTRGRYGAAVGFEGGVGFSDHLPVVVGLMG